VESLVHNELTVLLFFFHEVVSLTRHQRQR
jgi:hypothetical protein